MTDADDEDDGLKSLRAVWLSMPDEDPPERGLADLMAAARVKAEEMTAKPSLWQRFLESMRRPPVLALATVTVLIGGAVLVSNRSKDMDAQPTVSAPEAQTATAVNEKEARDEGAAATAGSAAPAPVEAPVVGGAAESQLEATHAEERKVDVAPKKRPEPRTGSSRERDELAKDKAKAAPTEVPKSTTKLDGARGEDSMVFDSDDEAPVAKQEATTRPTRGATSASPPKAEPPADSAALSSTPSVVQLHQSARAAAARGDCDAARRIATTIAKQDPAYYKAKVAGDASVTRCVLAQ